MQYIPFLCFFEKTWQQVGTFFFEAYIRVLLYINPLLPIFLNETSHHSMPSLLCEFIFSKIEKNFFLKYYFFFCKVTFAIYKLLVDYSPRIARFSYTLHRFFLSFLNERFFEKKKKKKYLRVPFFCIFPRFPIFVYPGSPPRWAKST